LRKLVILNPVKIRVPSKPSIDNRKQRGIVPNIINSIVRFNSIYISISLRGVLILGKALLRVLSRVVISKGKFSLSVFSID
jgi:hypothetical protein